MSVVPVALAALGPGELIAGRHGPIRSYDHEDWVFSWQPPAGLSFRRAALDVEARHQASAAAMAQRFGLPLSDFLNRWTATEAIAKVLDVPVLEFLRSRGLSEPASQEWQRLPGGVWLRALEHPTHWATVAVID